MKNQLIIVLLLFALCASAPNDSTGLDNQFEGMVLQDLESVDESSDPPVRGSGMVIGERDASLPTRPNIVMILLDDLDELISPYWEVLPRTAELIRDQGLTFEYSFAPNPICCPARATILTGLCSHNTGVLANNGDLGGWTAFKNPIHDDGTPYLDDKGNPIDNEDRTLAVYLSEGGYRTAFIGKYLNHYDGSSVPVGWSEWHAFVPIAEGMNTYYIGYGYLIRESIDDAHPRIRYHGFREEDYQTDVVAGLAIDAIGRAPVGQPLFLLVAPTAPHSPLRAAKRHKEFAERWVGGLPEPPNFNEPDISDKASWLQRSGEIRGWLVGRETIPDWMPLPCVFPRIEYADRMGSLYAVDEMVASVIDALRERGRLEETILVFTSDNGYNHGAHRLWQKQTPYDEALRVPLVVAGPGVRVGTSQAMVSQQDFAPTILELAGLPVPTHMNGRSFVDLLVESDATLRTERLRRDLLIESNSTGFELAAEWPRPLTKREQDLLYLVNNPAYRGLRTWDYAYFEWYLDEPHEYELYDMHQDPYQLDNLICGACDTEPWEAIVERLQRRLDELKTCKGSDCH